jgi:hypothetical protein
MLSPLAASQSFTSFSSLGKFSDPLAENSLSFVGTTVSCEACRVRITSSPLARTGLASVLSLVAVTN